MNPLFFRRIRGPVYLLCFALTAILAQWDILSYGRSWPLYIITAGLLNLVEALLPVGTVQTVYGGGAIPLVRRRSPAGSLLLLIIGVVTLLTTTDVLPFADFWRVYSTWWPLLLVLLGVLLLLERIFDRRAPAGAYVPRRRGSGGLVLLVLLLIGLGLAGPNSPYLSRSNWQWDEWNHGWGLPFTGETHENDVTFSSPLAADATLTVDNAHGDLQLAPSSDGMIHVEAHQTAHVPDRSKERAFRDSRPVLSVHGETASVTVPSRNGVDVRLVLAVPDGVLCTMHNHHGDIAISGLRRPITITQEHGAVALDSLGGDVRLTMDHGDVTARALAGDLTIDGRADDVSASGVKGRTSLRGEFFGDTELDTLGGPVEFHSNRTDLSAQRMTGQLSLDSDALRLSGVSGGLKIDTRSKEIEVTGLSGNAQITDSNSDVTVTARQPLGALTLTNSTGNVILSLPAAASFSLSGQTGNDDDIDSDFALEQSTSDGNKAIRGQVGQGGPHVEIRTSHGDLTLRRSTGDEEPEPPERPDAPEPPAAPGKAAHPRHLQAPAPSTPPAVQ